MNQKERYELRKHLRIQRWKKGKKLSKEEGMNILKGYNWANKKKPPKNWQPKEKKTEGIGDILKNMPLNQARGG